MSSRSAGLAFLCADEFLVCYDYGNGGLWGILIAPSEDSILARYPELEIAHARPKWLDDEQISRLYSETLRLADEPCGLLAVLVTDRNRA